MMSKSVHKSVLTESQLLGQESSTEFLTTLGALALILASIAALYLGYMMLTEDIKVLFFIGSVRVTLSLTGIIVMVFSVAPLIYAYKLLRRTESLQTE